MCKAREIHRMENNQGTRTNKTNNFILTLVLMHVFFDDLEIEKRIVTIGI